LGLLARLALLLLLVAVSPLRLILILLLGILILLTHVISLSFAARHEPQLTRRSADVPRRRG
jgi:hypothetical protein